MNEKISRKHHWIPEFYLNGFTGVGSKIGKVSVYDLCRRRVFTTSPRNVGAQRDFNRVDIPNQRPDVIENAFSGFESQAAEAVRASVKACEFADKDARDLIVNLICLLGVRNPRMREANRDFKERLLSATLDVIFADKNRFEREVTDAISSGFIRPEAEANYEQVRDYHRNNPLKITVPNEAHISQELETYDKVLPSLGDRQWVFFYSSDARVPFITSDHPVVLCAKSDGAIWSSGFGRLDLDVIFPLTRKVALVGGFDLSEKAFRINSEQVAKINAIVLAGAESQIYAPNERFWVFSEKHGRMMIASNL